MKKWSFLVATLLMMGATATTFTSCVDTDEPEGILEMRKAKAEYIRALAAVENAKIAYQQAAAQNEAANADLLKAQAEVAKAQAEVAKAQAQAEIIKAEAAAKAEALLAEGKNEIAKAEAAKLLAEAAQAEAECQQTIEENQIKLEEFKANLKIVLQKAETELVKAQMEYKLALKDLDALALVASDLEAKVLTQARQNYENAYSDLTTKANDVCDKQKDLIQAMYKEEDALATLNHKIADKEAELAAKQAAYEELQKLAESLTVDAWDAEIKSLKDELGDGAAWGATLTAAQNQGALRQQHKALELEKLQVLDKNPKVKQALDSTLLAYVIAQGKYNYLANESALDCIDVAGSCLGKLPAGVTATPYATKDDESTHPTGDLVWESAAKADYKFKADTIKVENKKIAELLGTDKLIYAEQKNLKYTDFDMPWKTSAEDAKGDKNTLNAAKAIAQWETDVKNLEVTIEAIAESEVHKDYAKDSADAAKALNDAKTAWQNAYSAYANQAVAQTVSTTDLEGAISDYNKKVGALNTAVTQFNKDYTDYVKAKTDARFNELKEDKLVTEFKTFIVKYNAYAAGLSKPTITLGSAQTTVSKCVNIVLGTAADITSGAITVPTGAAATPVEYNVSTPAKVVESAKKYAEAIFADINPSVLQTTYTDPAKLYGESLGNTAFVLATAASPAGDLKDKYTPVANAIADLNKDENAAGSKASLEKALKAFLKKAQNNCETPKADYAYADAAAITAQADTIAGKFDYYFMNGDSKDAKLTDAAIKNAAHQAGNAVWVAQDVKIDGATYVYQNALRVVRTEVSAANITKLKAVVFDKQKATENWIKTSNVAFGTIAPADVTVNADGSYVLTSAAEAAGKKFNARHTELTAAVQEKNPTTGVPTGNWLDENGRLLSNWTASKLYALQKAVEDKKFNEDLHKAKEYIPTITAAVAQAKANFEAQRAVYTAAIQAAKDAIAPVKAEHQKAHEAYEALTAEIVKQQEALVAKWNGLQPILAAAEAVREAYYSNTDIKYATFDGDTDESTSEAGYVVWSKSPKTFADVEKWVKAQMKKYTTKCGTPTTAASADDHGYIANAQAELDELNLQLKRATENGVDKKAVEAINAFLIAKAENNLAKAEAIHKLYLEKFNRAEAALNAVLEAIGNGVANLPSTGPGSAIVTPSGNPNNSGNTGTNNSGEYYGSSTTTTSPTGTTTTGNNGANISSSITIEL